MHTRTIGLELGVTASSQVAVAEGPNIEARRKVASTPAGLVAGLGEAAGGRPVNIVLESTAMAWFVAAVAAMRAGIDHSLFRVSGVKAAALRRFYRTHTKTDTIDAGVLARMPLVDNALRAFTLPSPDELALKRAVVLRHKLVGETTRIKDRIRSTLHWAAPGMLTGRDGVGTGFVNILARWPDLRALARARVTTIAKTGAFSKERAERIRDAADEAVAFYEGFVDFAELAVEFEVAAAHLASLQAQVDRLEQRISSLHRRLHPDDVLLTIPGIGDVVAAVIRATVGNLERFANLAALRAFTGLVPREDSSGESRRRGKISKAGPSVLRWALYLAADVARQWDPQLADLYRRLMVERGRHHTQAVCAVASHLVGRIWAVARDGRAYQWRDLDGTPITRNQARAIAQSLQVDPATRRRLRHKRRGPDVPRSRQPKAPHDNDRPSPPDLTEAALQLAAST